MGVFTTAIEEFEEITGYPLLKYLSDYVRFNATHYDRILSYNGGLVKSPFMPSFNLLANLLRRSRLLTETSNDFRDQLNRSDFWGVIEMCDDIKITLETVENSARYLRSSVTKKNFNTTQEVDHVLSSRQTLERVALDVTGSIDKENDWIELAMKNDVKEEDYTPEGGLILQLTSEESGTTVESVVDTLTKDSIYGKDIKRVLNFTDNDLEILPPRKTFEQSVGILSQLRKGDNPEYNEDGIQTSLAVGQNYASFAYPIIVRQLNDTFKKDDTIRSIKVLGIKPQEDALFIEFEIESRAGDFLVQKITI
jgi:hypothetical protein